MEPAVGRHRNEVRIFDSHFTYLGFKNKTFSQFLSENSGSQKQRTKTNFGPKPNVFYMHSVILNTYYFLTRDNVRVSWMQPQYGYTIESYAIGHQHSSFDTDSSYEGGSFDTYL